LLVLSNASFKESSPFVGKNVLELPSGLFTTKTTVLSSSSKSKDVSYPSPTSDSSLFAVSGAVGVSDSDFSVSLSPAAFVSDLSGLDLSTFLSSFSDTFLFFSASSSFFIVET
jgi:hypothetical protein